MRAEQASDSTLIPPSKSPLRGYQRWLFVLGALVLLWPALLQRDVYVFNDTVSYLRAADTLFVKLLGHQDPFFAAPAASGGGAIAAPTTGGGEARRMVLYGRSIYFGLFAYTGLLLGSIWVPIVAQALAASAVVIAALRHFVDPLRKRAFLRAFLIVLGVLACTPLPFFVCFLMPDLAVGLAIVATALLLCGWQRERVAWRLGLLALAVFAALSHSSAVAIMALLAIAALILGAIRRERRTAIPAALVLVAALSGVAGEAAFGLVTRMTTGIDPIRPPFLTARLIEDGPARRYQAEHCARSDFVLCRYPIRGEVSAEVFLWVSTRPRGGFKALPTADAVQVSHEQTRFALAVARAYPRETALALLRDVVSLATNLQLQEFLPQFTAGRMPADGEFQGPPPDAPLPKLNRVVSGLTLMLVLASLVGLAWIARAGSRPGWKAIVFTVVAGIVLNDVICACLSGPFARYNTRVIWALPLVAALFVLARRDVIGEQVRR